MSLRQNHLSIDTSVYIPLQHRSSHVQFSWRTELRHFFSHKFLSILFWPVFKYRQRRFTHSVLFMTCKNLPGFTDLWKTIQKGAFAYNTLFLKVSPYRYCSALDLADITTLALFFGDEFIDGISTTVGKSSIRQLINTDQHKFYLKKKKRKGRITLEYQFNLFQLLSDSVWKKVNEKYQITYHRFYILLQYFLQLINKELARLPDTEAERAADKITNACNTCFESFLHDINNCFIPGTIPAVPMVLHFHETKTAYMQARLLELRCSLAKKEDVMNSVQMPGWMDIMRVIQVYDDIHDIVIDDGVQENLLLSAAYHHFPDEWKWFDTNKGFLKTDKQTPLLLSLYMPCSIEYCMQLASDKIKKMNWEQQKIMHYLLFKNKYVLYQEKNEENLATTGFLLKFYQKIKDRMPHLSMEAIKSYAVDTCIHLPGTRKQLLNSIDFSKVYQLRYNLLSVPAETKAAIFDLITTK